MFEQYLTHIPKKFLGANPEMFVIDSDLKDFWMFQLLDSLVLRSNILEVYITVWNLQVLGVM